LRSSRRPCCCIAACFFGASPPPAPSTPPCAPPGSSAAVGCGRRHVLLSGAGTCSAPWHVAQAWRGALPFLASGASTHPPVRAPMLHRPGAISSIGIAAGNETACQLCGRLLDVKICLGAWAQLARSHGVFLRALAAATGSQPPPTPAGQNMGSYTDKRASHCAHRHTG
jgi:hypothetical protein